MFKNGWFIFILKNPQLIFENFQQKWTMFSWNDDNLTVLWFQNLYELMDIHEQVARQFEVDWIYDGSHKENGMKAM